MNSWAAGKWGSVDDMVRSHHQLERKLGAPADRLLTLPDAEAGTDAWNEVYDRLGRPSDAASYAVSDDLKALLPDAEQAALSVYADAAHAAGLSDAQFSAMQGAATGVLKQVEQAIADGFQAATADLEKSNPDKMGQIRTLMTERGIDESQMVAAMKGDSTAFLGILSAAAESVAQEGNGDELGGLQAGQRRGLTMTAVQAEAEIARLHADPGFMQRYNSDDRSVRMAAANELEALYKAKRQK